MGTMRSIVATSAFAILVGSALIAAAPPAVAAAVACQGWDTAPRTASNFDNELSSVAMTGRCNAFAVGGYRNGSESGPFSVLIEHWDGTRWVLQLGPNPGPTENWLGGVATTSSSNAFAVGYQTNVHTDKTLVERWNGSGWQVTSSPNVAGRSNDLNAVAATSASNAWAVGDSYDGSHLHTLIEHWNGTSWKLVSSPNVGTDSELLAVAASSASNAWAVGDSLNGSTRHTLIEHWNGTSWKVVTSPNRGTLSNGLAGVAVTSTSNAWAVGYNVSATTDEDRPLIERWNGQTWSLVSSPAPFPFTDERLNAVAATSVSNAWAVGDSVNQESHTIVEHWDGTGWSVEYSPDPGPTAGGSANDLNGIAAVSPTAAWAVGEYLGASALVPLALRCC
jgi:hypothetical protein